MPFGCSILNPEIDHAEYERLNWTVVQPFATMCIPIMKQRNPMIREKSGRGENWQTESETHKGHQNPKKLWREHWILAFLVQISGIHFFSTP
jgi:hypothetical protein